MYKISLILIAIKNYRSYNPILIWVLEGMKGSSMMPTTRKNTTFMDPNEFLHVQVDRVWWRGS